MDDTTLGMILATVQDTNARVRRMEAAVIEDAKERARWNRVQQAIAATLDPLLATEMESVADSESQTDQTPSTDGTPATGALNEATVASMFTDARVGGTRIRDGVEEHWSGPAPAKETVSPDTVRSRYEIDPDELDWFVGQDGKFYIRGDKEKAEPDRRATKAESFAISNQVGSTRSRRAKMPTSR